MKTFTKGGYYRCIHNLVNIEWLSKCHFTKGKRYKAYSDCGLIDDHTSRIVFPSIFDTERYFVEDETV